jgi:hypothetical protein
MNLLSTKAQDLWTEVERERARHAEAQAAYHRALLELADLDLLIEERLRDAEVPSAGLRAALRRELGREAKQLEVEDLASELNAVPARIKRRKAIYDAQVLVEDQAWLARGKSRVLELLDRARHRVPAGPDGTGDFVEFVRREIWPELRDVAAIEAWWGAFTGYLQVGVGSTYLRRPQMLPLSWRVVNPEAAAEWVLEVSRLAGLNGKVSP